MIELRHDQLRFAFPEINAELRALVAGHVDEHLPALLAGDRQAAVDALFRDRWRGHAKDSAFRLRAARDAAALRDDTLALTFRELAFTAASLSEEEGAGDDSPATLSVEFQRTLRLPDDGRTYPLPAGLGRFPMRHAEDFADRLPAAWAERGGVLMPMYQAEALWINFGWGAYPCAVKIAAGKVNAVSAEAWRAGLHKSPAQDYVVVPGQPWLDGFAVARGVIRQFVAMPLGGGHSVEEQLTGRADTGGIQIQVHPLRAAVHFRETLLPRLPRTLAEVLAKLIQTPAVATLRCDRAMPCPSAPRVCADAGMGLGMGGKMRQEIHADHRPLPDWDQEVSARCFVHLCNSAVWREITGANPPQPPVTAREYARAGLPWFDHYDEQAPGLPGAKRFEKVKSVFRFGKEKGDAPLPGGNGLVPTPKVILLGPSRRPGQVREWTEGA